jgi:hypothetical protein
LALAALPVQTDRQPILSLPELATLKLVVAEQEGHTMLALVWDVLAAVAVVEALKIMKALPVVWRQSETFCGRLTRRDLQMIQWIG